MGGLGQGEIVGIVIAAVIVFIALVVPAVLICRKAGFSPWLGILAIVPIANLVLLWYVALAAWPSRRFATRRE